MLTCKVALGALVVAAFASPAQLAAQTLLPVHTDSAAIAAARADSVRRPYTTADVAFVSGMIHHHAQAIVMANWAPTHGASADVRTLSGRIINAQLDEIHRMQQWLADRGQAIVSPQLSRDTSMRDMPDMQPTLMPGMLSNAQLDSLDHARGEAFDRLFLTYMIQHHTGAVHMVQQLFSTYGAGQDETIFKMATDINVDQRTEIARMHRMLVAMALAQ
jgi:uncharacterized protein (DUF305 family)